MGRRGYAPQFRRKVLDLVEFGRPVAEVAHDLGIGAPSPTPTARAWLTDLITEVNQHSRGTYGSRRVHAGLRLGPGIQVGHGAVEMLIRRAGRLLWPVLDRG